MTPDDAKPPKRPKRPALKPPSRRTVERVKCTLYLTVETSRRLSVHGAMLNLDRSELVERLVQEHLRRFVVSDRGPVETNAGPAPVETVPDADGPKRT